MRCLSFSELLAYWACPRLSAYKQRPGLRLARRPSQAQWGIRVHEQLHRSFLGLPTDLQKKNAELWACYEQAIAPYETQSCQGFSEWECVAPLPELNVVVSGRLDRLYLQENTLQIMDWKTGTLKEATLAATHLQLRFYAWLVWLSRECFRNSGFEKVVASAFYLQENHTESFTLTTKNSEQEHAFFTDLICHYLEQSSQTFSGIPDPRSTPEGVWCTMCEYKGLCPEGKYHA